MPDINRKIAKGALWMVSLRLAVKGIGLLSTLILVRILSPDDFGLMALAMTVYAGAQLLNEFGFDTVLIQNQSASDDYYHTAWTINVIFSTISALCIYGISDWVVLLYSDDRLEMVLIVLSIAIIFNGLRNIGIVQFRKHMDFDKEFKYEISIKICSFIVTVALALVLQSYVALFMGILSGSVAAFVFSYVMHPFRPKLSLVKWRDLFAVSVWLYVNNFLTYINTQSQSIVLGRVSDVRNVGLYAVSSEVGTVVRDELIAPINRAAYPGYSKISRDFKQLNSTYLRVLGSILLVSLPCNVGIFVISPIMVPAVLGVDWNDAVIILQYIALSSIFDSFNTNLAYMYYALGRQRIITYIIGLRVMIFVPVLYYFSSILGAEGAGVAMLISSVAVFPINQYVFSKQTGVKIYETLGVLWRPLFSSVCMAVVVHYFQANVVLTESIINLLFLVLIGALVFIVTLYYFWVFSGKPAGAEESAFRFCRKHYLNCLVCLK